MKKKSKILLLFIVPASIVIFSFLGRPAKNAHVLQERTQLQSVESISAHGYMSPKSDDEVPAEISRKVIRNGEISLVVKNYSSFYRELRKQLMQVGGYISEIQVSRDSRDIASAVITFRVPPGSLDAVVSWLGEEGIVASEKMKAEDISENYYDLKARLDNAGKFELRLLEMLKTQTGKLNDVVLVEEKLNQVREQIEQMQGKLRILDNLVGMATLTLNVSVEAQYAAPHPPTFSERAASTWKESTRTLIEVATGTALLAITLVPWIVPVFAATLVLRYFYLIAMRWRYSKSFR